MAKATEKLKKNVFIILSFIVFSSLLKFNLSLPGTRFLKTSSVIHQCALPFANAVLSALLQISSLTKECVSVVPKQRYKEKKLFIHGATVQRNRTRE